MPSFDDESLPELALAPAEPPCAPDDDEPPIEPDEPLPEPVTDELPNAPVPDEDEPPWAPDEPVLDAPPVAPVPDDSEEPVDDEPVDDEPDEPLAPLDEPLRPPLLPDALEPPVLPALLVPPTAPLLEPVAGLALDDAPPLMLPDEPALAEEPLLPLPRLDCWSLPRLDWSLPMPLPLCLLASTPFPSLDF